MVPCFSPDPGERNMWTESPTVESHPGQFERSADTLLKAIHVFGHVHTGPHRPHISKAAKIANASNGEFKRMKPDFRQALFDVGNKWNADLSRECEGNMQVVGRHPAGARNSALQGGEPAADVSRQVNGNKEPHFLQNSSRLESGKKTRYTSALWDRAAGSLVLLSHTPNHPCQTARKAVY